MLFAEGRNVKQVQRWLGHAKASITLDTYLHLLDEGVGEPLEIGAGAGQRGRQGSSVDGLQPHN
jgi:integrase